MKKFFVSILCVVMVVCSTFGLSACKNNDNSSSDVSFENINIGYNLPIYPTCEFNYKVSDDCTVHIDNIKIELTGKNVVNSDDTLSSPYYPYVFHVSASGSTDAKHAGKKIYLRLVVEEMYQQMYYYETVIAADGSIQWEYDQTNWTSATRVYFHYIAFNF